MIELKPRLVGATGIPAWHDAPALQRGIEFASRGKSMSQLAVPLEILRKLQEARVGAKGQINTALDIELNEAQGKILWETVGELPVEAFWLGAHPPILTIKEFLDELKEAINGTG